MKSNSENSVNNIYKLDGRVPLGKAIPFGSHHHRKDNIHIPEDNRAIRKKKIKNDRI
ncbi:hypothetical protein [Lacrimispora brassicae]